MTLPLSAIAVPFTFGPVGLAPELEGPPEATSPLTTGLLPPLPFLNPIAAIPTPTKL